MPKTIPGHAQSCCSQDETPFGLVHCTLKTLSWADSPWKMVVERVDPRMKPYLELIRFDKVRTDHPLCPLSSKIKLSPHSLSGQLSCFGHQVSQSSFTFVTRSGIELIII